MRGPEYRIWESRYYLVGKIRMCPSNRQSSLHSEDTGSCIYAFFADRLQTSVLAVCQGVRERERDRERERQTDGDRRREVGRERERGREGERERCNLTSLHIL